MNLRQLRYFQTVGELNSVTRAAGKLNVAQPALTRHLKELQDELGVRLVERNGRGIALNAAGRHLLNRLSGILGEIDRLPGELTNIDAGGQTLSLGIPTGLSATIGARLMDRMQREAGIDMLVLDGWSGFVVEWLNLRRLDAGVIYDHHAIDNAEFHIEPLALEPQFLIASRYDPIAERASISPAEAFAMPLVLPSQLHGLRHFVDAKSASIGHNLQPVIEIDSMTTIKRVVEQKKLYSIMGQCETGSNLPPELTSIRIDGPALDRLIYLAWPKRANKKGLDSGVIGTIKAEFLKFVESGEWGSAYLG